MYFLVVLDGLVYKTLRTVAIFKYAGGWYIHETKVLDGFLPLKHFFKNFIPWKLVKKTAGACSPDQLFYASCGDFIVDDNYVIVIDRIGSRLRLHVDEGLIAKADTQGRSYKKIFRDFKKSARGEDLRKGILFHSTDFKPHVTPFSRGSETLEKWAARGRNVDLVHRHLEDLL